MTEVNSNQVILLLAGRTDAQGFQEQPLLLHLCIYKIKQKIRLSSDRTVSYMIGKYKATCACSIILNIFLCRKWKACMLYNIGKMGRICFGRESFTDDKRYTSRWCYCRQFENYMKYVIDLFAYREKCDKISLFFCMCSIHIARGQEVSKWDNMFAI